MVEKNPLSNLSYTNKDFQEIYPELLNYVKNISYKWDPTISNESDPGLPAACTPDRNAWKWLPYSMLFQPGQYHSVENHPAEPDSNAVPSPPPPFRKQILFISN